MKYYAEAADDTALGEGAGGAVDTTDAGPSIRDELLKASDAIDKRETPTETEDNKGKSPNVSEAARILAKSRQVAAKEAAKEAKEAKEEAEEEDEKSDESEEQLDAPQHWSQADKDLFGKQASDVKKYLLARHKAMESDYTRKTQELGSVRRFKEQMDEVFGPYREAMARDGIDDATAIRQLVAAHAYLQKSPQEGIRWLAQKYGIDLQQMGSAQQEASQLDPALTALQQKQAEIDRKLESFFSAKQQEEHKVALSQVEQFAAEKDAQGQLTHPHFEEVAAVVARLIRAAKAGGENLTLRDAYEQAVYANPQTRGKLLAAQEAERRAKDEAERKAKADAAKKAAAANIEGQGAATPVVAKNDSLRADLEAAFAGVERV